MSGSEEGALAWIGIDVSAAPGDVHILVSVGGVGTDPSPCTLASADTGS
ncbi:hypothetical protein ACWEK5_34830 [Rhodococcus koreensis]